MKIFVAWQVSRKELEDIAKNLEETPIISVEIEPDVELVIKNKDLFKRAKGKIKPPTK